MTESLAPLATLKNRGLLAPDGDAYFRIERHFLISLLADKIAAMPFDESWYLSKYPDVRDAVKRRIVASAHDHFVQFGYLEHRIPRAIAVRERWYLDSYPDVAAALRAGVYKSAQAHFDSVGYQEGRLPYPNFKL